MIFKLRKYLHIPVVDGKVKCKKGNISLDECRRCKCFGGAFTTWKGTTVVCNKVCNRQRKAEKGWF